MYMEHSQCSINISEVDNGCMCSELKVKTYRDKDKDLKNISI